MSKNEAVSSFKDNFVEKALEIATSTTIFILIAASALLIGQFTHIIKEFGAPILLIEVMHTGENALIIMDAAFFLTHISRHTSRNLV